MTEAQRDVIWDVYLERHVLMCFSFGRLLESDELLALTAGFGENEFGPGSINGIGKKAEPGEKILPVEEQVAALKAKGIEPFLATIGNLEPDTLERKPVAKTFFGEWEWHTDMSYIPVPLTFTLLHARILPEEGGDTGFCNQVMAAKALPSALRERVLGLTVKHDSTHTSSGTLRPGMTSPVTPVEAIGHAHPILRKVPTTDEEAIYLGRRTNGYITCLSLNESEALFTVLWEHATKPEFCYRHKWHVGQVVVWDDRIMLHMRYPVDEILNHFMWRTQTKGEAVIPA